MMAVEKAVGLEAEAGMAVAANTLERANDLELGGDYKCTPSRLTCCLNLLP